MALTNHISIKDAAYEELHLVLITGMSGAGKSVALKALEDSGYFCIDNLPAELIPELLLTFKGQEKRRTHVAIAIDGRTYESLHLFPAIYRELEGSLQHLKLIYLNSNNASLIHRFSETRRRHPLSGVPDGTQQNQTLVLKEAIERERLLLAPLIELGGAVIDTSLLRAAQLRSWIKEIVQIPKNQLTLVFESFAFKKGIPINADFVFDMRILPNPYYESQLKALTGMDQEVQNWLSQSEEVQLMFKHLTDFLNCWLPSFVKDHRSYLTIAIGCTGGQHRSVYFVEKLAEYFMAEWPTIKRHREQFSQD